MKAYSVTDKWECTFSTIVFAKSHGQARAKALHTDACEGSEFCDISARRVPALDQFYRGRDEMDWCNDEDRITMVKYAGYSCSEEIYDPECAYCPAAEFCGRAEEEENGEIH